MTTRVTPVAKSVPFDNTTNGYTASDVQAAIEEAKEDAIALPRFSIVTVFNGTVSNDQWLGYNNLIPGDSRPIFVPVKCRLKELTFVSGPFLVGTVDGNLRLYRSGLTSGDVFATIPFDNEDTKIVSGINQLFNLGDYLVGRWEDTGNNPSDMVITYFFQVEE